MTKDELEVLVEEQEELLETLDDALDEGDVEEAKELLDGWFEDDDDEEDADDLEDGDDDGEGVE